MPPLPPADLDHILDHTRELWEELRGRRVFITGGTGFFGLWLLESFAHANAQLALNATAVVLTRNPDAFRQKAPHLFGNPSIQLVGGDVRAFSFPAGEFSHVIHAGTTSSAPVPPLEMLDTITAGTRRVLDFAVACRAKKLLFTSSGAVYGRQPPDMTHIPETYPGAPDPADPNSAYGEGKRAAELLCAIHHQQHGLETKIARCFAFVGPHLPLDAHFAIGNFIRDAMRGGPIQVNDGTPLRSYLYAADLAIWLWTILFKGQACRPCNVGSNEAISIADLARLVVQAIAPNAQISCASTPQLSSLSTPPPLPSRYVPDTARAQQELDLHAWTGLQEAIEKTAEWHRQR